jgi:hypothetical protein
MICTCRVLEKRPPTEPPPDAEGPLWQAPSPRLRRRVAVREKGERRRDAMLPPVVQAEM